MQNWKQNIAWGLKKISLSVYMSDINPQIVLVLDIYSRIKTNHETITSLYDSVLWTFLMNDNLIFIILLRYTNFSNIDDEYMK